MEKENTGSKAGLEVTLEEIVAFKKRSHTMCNGTGKLTFIVGDHTKETKERPAKRQDVACGCAVRRFSRKHADDVETDKKGKLVWKKESDHE
jgi:hypothetical protein